MTLRLRATTVLFLVLCLIYDDDENSATGQALVSKVDELWGGAVRAPLLLSFKQDPDALSRFVVFFVRRTLIFSLAFIHLLIYLCIDIFIRIYFIFVCLYSLEKLHSAFDPFNPKKAFSFISRFALLYRLCIESLLTSFGDVVVSARVPRQQRWHQCAQGRCRRYRRCALCCVALRCVALRSARVLVHRLEWRGVA